MEVPAHAITVDSLPSITVLSGAEPPPIRLSLPSSKGFHPIPPPLPLLRQGYSGIVNACPPPPDPLSLRLLLLHPFSFPFISLSGGWITTTWTRCQCCGPLLPPLTPPSPNATPPPSHFPLIRWVDHNNLDAVSMQSMKVVAAGEGGGEQGPCLRAGLSGAWACLGAGPA